jgi:hypothetical protein
LRWSFDRELSGNSHRYILDDIGGGFVSSQGDELSSVMPRAVVRWRTVGEERLALRW